MSAVAAAQVGSLEGEASAAREAARGAEAEATRLEADRDRYREQVAELQSQVWSRGCSCVSSVSASRRPERSVPHAAVCHRPSAAQLWPQLSHCCCLCCPPRTACLQNKSMTELYQNAQKYNGQLQEYNGRMQAELQAANEAVGRAQVQRWGRACSWTSRSCAGAVIACSSLIGRCSS